MGLIHVPVPLDPIERQGHCLEHIATSDVRHVLSSRLLVTMASSGAVIDKIHANVYGTVSRNVFLAGFVPGHERNGAAKLQPCSPNDWSLSVHTSQPAVEGIGTLQSRKAV